MKSSLLVLSFLVSLSSHAGVTVSALCDNGDRVIYNNAEGVGAITVNGSEFNHSLSTNRVLNKAGEITIVQSASNQDDEGKELRVVSIAFTQTELSLGQFRVIGFRKSIQSCKVTEYWRY